MDVNQARIALNHLHAEGIQAWLSNETIVTNDWLLGQAVGNVQLQVGNADFERATSALEISTDLPPSELDELALAAEKEEQAKPLFGFFYPEGVNDSEDAHSKEMGTGSTTKNADGEVDPDNEPNAREWLVDRAFRASILFLLLPFLSPLLTWMLLEIWSNEQMLSKRHQRKLVWAILLHVPTIIFILIFIRQMVHFPNG